MEANTSTVHGRLSLTELYPRRRMAKWLRIGRVQYECEKETRRELAASL